ncbi:transmembrane protein, putative [Rhizoctonia solani AG-3 Rhs1AP]|uniref:Transmembrane protein, putative n=1 Tax=Rhizoctonia solani AG-3 Rhs1AP TaxID=1086054 RepID=A0A0A1UJT7_9AGAM|nr:transmembrane protein, putative [Rhizoctonia solani AG-3 Rhs1AP]
MELLLTSLIVFETQVFTAHHAWKSVNRINVFWATPRVIRYMGIIAAIFAFSQLTFGTTLSSLAWIHRDIREMEKYQWVASLWLGTATFGSIIITYMLSALLASTYVQAQSTIYLINEFLRCIIHTGFLTSILTVANLLAFSFMGQYIRIAANIPLGTLNLITLLVIMNSRPQEISDGAIVEEHVRSMTGHKDRSLKDRSQTSLESCSQISQRFVAFAQNTLQNTHDRPINQSLCSKGDSRHQHSPNWS